MPVSCLIHVRPPRLVLARSFVSASQPDGTRYSVTSQGLMERLTNGNIIDAFAGLERAMSPRYRPGAMDGRQICPSNGVTFDVSNLASLPIVPRT